MAEAIVGPIIEVMIGKLLTYAEEQISLVSHFKDDLKTLQKSFSMVRAYLHDAEKKKVTEEAVKNWLRELEDLAFDADNVIDEIDYKRLSKQVKNPTTNKTVKEKVQSLFSCSSPISFRQKMGSRIKVINERLEKCNQWARDFGLQSSLTNAQDSRLDASRDRETSSLSEDLIFLGRENEVWEIANMLTATTPSGQKSISVLPIVGMGGKGKTTFARKVFHDQSIKSHFGDKNRIWVYVSQNFDVNNILKNILTSLKEENVPDSNSREALLQKLQKHLGATKYLLVLDDVWNEDREKWDDFVSSLSGISSANGYCMIVTTRSEEVASIVEETLPVHKLKGLFDDDCWSIIKAKALRVGETPSEFDAKEEIGKNIAKKCQGLPLAAKVVGGLLSSMKSKDEWKSIEENWLSDDENPISNVLKLSFDHLPSPSLKKCFAYCSIFPKGYEIEKERLVELWMAEGFFQTNHQKSNNNIENMETIGSKNFNILLRNSLLQYLRSDDYGNVTHCNMHDLVHDLACSILCENNEGVCKIRYIGYKPGGGGFLSIPKGQERYVRTLFFDGKISDIKFSDFESLHTLTLAGCDINDLPNSIRELKHLRYLDISETCIKYFPNSIGELYHLQTLRTNVQHYVETVLPYSFKCLISLRHLHISSAKALPPEIGKLTCLQTLPYIHVGDKKGCGISELGKLKDLKGELEIRNLEKVRNKNEAMRADLLQKQGIYKLKLVWCMFRRGDEVNYESVLEGLQPHPNLKSLGIFGFNGKILPRWTSKMEVHLNGILGSWEALNNLMEIKLIDCRELEELPSLGQLRNLKSLELKGLTNVKSIRPSFYGIDNCAKDRVFPALKMLVLENMENLKEWDGAGDLPLHPSTDEVVLFPVLEILFICNCARLTNLPIEMLESCALSLEKLSLHGLSSLTQNAFEVIGRSLHKMTRLTYLQIFGVPKFSIISSASQHDDLKTVRSLKSLVMVPISFSDSDSDSNSDSSWNNVSFNENVNAMLLRFTSLRQLILYGMEDWECLPDAIQHLTSLQELLLYNFGGIEALPEWFGNLSSLEKFFLTSCKNLRHLPSKTAMLRMSKLIYLFILGSPLLLKEKSSNNYNNSERPEVVDSEWPKISHIPDIQIEVFR